MNHAWVEKNVGALIVLILIAVSLGGIVEIFPQFFERNLTRIKIIFKNALLKNYEFYVDLASILC